jgi:hypothetical protein
MNEHENQLWQKLVALSAPTYAGDESVPYGFTTRFLADWRAGGSRQCELVERIGFRALLASLSLLLLAAAAHFSVRYLNHTDLEPGLRGFVQVENVQVS